MKTDKAADSSLKICLQISPGVIHMRGVIHIGGVFICVSLETFAGANQLILWSLQRETHVMHNSLICVTFLFHTCDMISFMCVPCFVHTVDVTHSCESYLTDNGQLQL